MVSEYKILSLIIDFTSHSKC